ncbi:MAG: DUF433 domain-containing protein [Chloroflexi bacterium]|nr:DUF433 domain-containing protein [Chloroflexota bacterium]
MSNSGNGHNGWRTQPMYSFSEAAHLAGVSTQTVRNWLFGYSVDNHLVSPLFQTSSEQSPFCSFLQLIEIVVAARFRKSEHTSFQTVKRAYDNAQKEWELDYPFAHLRLKSLGGHIVRIISGDTSLQSVDNLNQWTLPGLVTETLEQLEYELELAAKWYPVGKKIPIVVDPRISAGLPVVEGRGVTVQAILKRFDSDQKISFIAKDFELKESTIEDVVRYGRKVLTGVRDPLDSTLR